MGRNYNDQDVIKKASEVFSLAGLLRALQLKPAGGNFVNMKRKLQNLQVDTSHWTGRAWNTGQQLKDWSDYTNVRDLRKHLIKERGHRCECCFLVEWLGEPITLEVHHINADRTINAKSNLKLLCPNCHALTETWRGRKGSNPFVPTE